MKNNEKDLYLCHQSQEKEEKETKTGKYFLKKKQQKTS